MIRWDNGHRLGAEGNRGREEGNGGKAERRDGRGRRRCGITPREYQLTATGVATGQGEVARDVRVGSLPCLVGFQGIGAVFLPVLLGRIAAAAPTGAAAKLPLAGPRHRPLGKRQRGQYRKKRKKLCQAPSHRSLMIIPPVPCAQVPRSSAGTPAC